MACLVFDVETIPDVVFGRAWLETPQASDAEVMEALQHQRMQKDHHTMLQHVHHQVVAISCAYVTDHAFKLASLGEEGDDEATLLQHFFQIVNERTPQLVTWNGGGFDLPVLHYRALKHRIRAARYFDMGQNDPNMKWNNYHNRYHSRHLDLMDVMAGYQSRASAGLDKTAVLLGLPGKQGLSGASVAHTYLKGDRSGIRTYCESDVLNTYGLFVRFQYMSGAWDAGACAQACTQVLADLKLREDPIWIPFRTWFAQEHDAWQGLC